MEQPLRAVSHAALPESHLDDDPITTQTSVDRLARLIAHTLPRALVDRGSAHERLRADEPTMPGEPSFDLLSLSAGADEDAVAVMRALYVSGDAEGALAVAALLGAPEPRGASRTAREERGAEDSEVEEALRELDRRW